MNSYVYLEKLLKIPSFHNFHTRNTAFCELTVKGIRRKELEDILHQTETSASFTKTPKGVLRRVFTRAQLLLHLCFWQLYFARYCQISSGKWHFYPRSFFRFRSSKFIPGDALPSISFCSQLFLEVREEFASGCLQQEQPTQGSAKLSAGMGWNI